MLSWQRDVYKRQLPDHVGHLFERRWLRHPGPDRGVGDVGPVEVGLGREHPVDRALEEHEPGWEDYPASMDARRGRDRDLRAEVDELLARAEGLTDRQRLAITAAVHSTYSVRTIATAAQRWGLTLEEAGEGHAWVLETLLEALRTNDIEPWEDVR